MNKILHIDFDSFFASVEQQYNPKFRNKPLGVLASNSRSCIVAASRQAKRLGITTGSRSFEAKNICPSLILVPADFTKYWEVSKKFLNICKDYSPEIEIFSIDEIFMDATMSAHLFGGVNGIIEKIKNRIKKEIGEYITVSVGISHNKLLAKLASGLQKPNGLTQIRPDNVEEIYKTAKLVDICGIGERVKIRLNKIGVYSLLDLRDIPFPALLSEFGKMEAYFLKNIGLGLDSSPVIPYTIAPSVKSVSRNYCLPKNEINPKIILQNIYELCEEIGIKLRRLNKKASVIGLSLRGSGNEHSRKTIKNYIDSGKEIFNVCKDFYTEWGFETCPERSRRMVRMISVWAGGLEDKNNLPLPLFSSSLKNERLLLTVDKINERFGGHTIRNGFLLYADKLTTVPNGYMADKYERTKLSREF